ncbi:MAG: DUF6242 domain-containing protein [Dysgonamonadaceae bacterium]|jgi:hypothetical protein|nr:DUF6242 domain-containing protein [Dysgonamonadaceae bacterium]
MNIKNLYQGFIFSLLGAVILFPSCLGSDNEDYEYSSDAQVYGFTATGGDYDSLSVLSKAVFAIDQLASPPKIYTKDSLAYGFEVKNAVLSINTNNALGIVLYYEDADSSFVFNSSDSVNLSRLTKITVYANDGVTNREYAFKINTHQQDPYILVWKNIANGYFSASPVSEQKTIALNDKFFTYYVSGGTINALSASSTAGNPWASVSVSGLPSNTLLHSLLTATDNSVQTAYAVAADNTLYQSSDGISWNSVATSYPVEAIYGKIPSTTVDSLVVVVKDGADLKFAKTKDFSSIRVLGTIPSGFPVRDFSALSMQDENSYTAKYIVVAGGSDAGGTQSNDTWIVQEKNGSLGALSHTTAALSLQGCSLFAYDGKLYIFTESGNENRLSISKDYGLTWNTAPAKQAIPDNFPHRKYASVITDDKNFIWIFGGTSGSSQLADAWRGRINRLIVN